jgi:hypothetical protein
MNVTVDVKPSLPHAGTSLASSLCPLMQAAGRPEWSMARLVGVMGHAFQFEMKEGGGSVMHDHIDWGLALDLLPEIVQFRTFNATARDEDIDLPALKREARDAVRAGLARGYPAMAWSPMSPEMKAEPPPHPVCWGLLIGYNETEETYTVRHPWVSDTYTVRYDAIGPGGHNPWFNVKVFDKPSAIDEKTTHLRALRDAVAFADGTRYKGDDDHSAEHRAQPQGFAAYDLWREAFGSEDIPLESSRHNADMLKSRRLLAAEYVRELTVIFPEAAEPLAAAATHYDRELESLNPLYDLCVAAKKNQAWSAGNRAEAGRLIGEALKADREAIASIEAALSLLNRSQ